MVDSEGNAYAPNAYGADVRDGEPVNLADQLSPPEGWSFRVVVPSEDLVLEAPVDTPTHMVGDDMKQYYTRVD